jgi:DNA invertase Pin-like site-specific DNA recombinase
MSAKLATSGHPRKRVSARKAVGKASNWMWHLSDLTAKGLVLAVLYCRASTNEQDDDGCLLRAIIDAIKKLKAAGVRIIAVYDGVETSNIYGDRLRLMWAIEEARQHGAVLVAPSRDRFIRARSFCRGQKLKAEPPNEFEYRELARMTDGVLLATIQDPDASPEEVRSQQTLGGQRIGGRKGGRPRKSKPGDKKRRRAELTPQVVELHQQGMSNRAIGRQLKVAEPTVRRWLSKGCAIFAAEQKGPGGRQAHKLRAKCCNTSVVVARRNRYL